MHPKDISIAGYRYDLPATSIAWHPLTTRDDSKLLIYRDAAISEDIYRHIGDHIPEGSLLVFNNTKVVEARIIFQKETGGQIEIFCLEPPHEYGGMAAAMSQTSSVRWICLIGGASKWKPGQVLRKTIASDRFNATVEPSGTIPAAVESFGPILATVEPSGPIPATAESSGTIPPSDQNTPIVLEARYVDKLDGAFLVGLSWTPKHLSFAEILHEAGLIPLPPYIRRTPEKTDSERYQTVYARHDGSVAAPTAGLHFTEPIFQSLAARHIERSFVTLHVGAGTFLPVKAATMEQHSMHTEYISVSADTIHSLLAHLRQPLGDPELQSRSPIDPNVASPASPDDRTPLIIPVGTTSARTIESLYWLGVKTILHPEIEPADLAVQQWDAYEEVHHTDGKGRPITADQALTSLLSWMQQRDLTQLVSQTQLLITPGYDWKIAGALITNFHQPESTLLLLVASLIGEDWKKVYDHALRQGFRFLSYGDGCLLFPSLQRNGKTVD